MVKAGSAAKTWPKQRARSINTLGRRDDRAYLPAGGLNGRETQLLDILGSGSPAGHDVWGARQQLLETL